MTLTKEQLADLRKPFSAEQIKWKIQTQPKGDKLEGWGVVVSYLDSRDVAERLDVIVGGEWQDDYNLFGNALECSLTVCGVTRKDVGEAASPKELYSDAFKRAAVKFGVGAFLYRMPTVMAKMVRKDARSNQWKLADGAAASLKAIGEAVAKGERPKERYPDLMLLSAYQAPEQFKDEGGETPSEQPQKAQQMPEAPQEPDRSKDDLQIGQAGAVRLDRELKELGIKAPITYARKICNLPELEVLNTLTVKQARQLKHAAGNQQNTAA